MASKSTLGSCDLEPSWEEDRKFVIRGWSLVLSALATGMTLSMVDGRLAYLQGPYTGYVGYWINCRKYNCARLNQVTVLIHMSLGFLWLALALSFFVLLPTMCVSFPLIFHRLQKVDLAFSVLSFGIGFLIIISQVLFVINCETLSPKPKITYLMTTYLCWSAGVLMLSTGLLNYLNQLGMFSKRKLSTQHQQSFHRWASMQINFKRESKVDAVGQPSRTTVSP